MRDGFGDAEEHQPDAHACSEQHCKPKAIVAIRWTVVRPQLDAAITAHRNPDHDYQESGDSQDGEPAGIVGGPGLGRSDQRVATAGAKAASASRAITIVAVGINTCGRMRWRTAVTDLGSRPSTDRIRTNAPLRLQARH